MIQMSQRFIITENCNASCPHCFNANERDGGTIDANLLIEYLKKNSMYLPTSDFRMMGGEPTLHPRFSDIVDEAAKHVRLIKVYSNGLKLKEVTKDHNVMMAHFNDKLIYILNGYTFSPRMATSQELQKYVKRLAVHMVVTTDGVDKMIEKTHRFLDLYPFIYTVISPDSQVNIFDEDTLNAYREAWMKAVKSIVPRTRNIGFDINIDHSFPMCFYTQDMIEELARHDLEGLHMKKQNCCAETRMGLTDWNWDLYYCNQTRIKIGSVLNDEGQPKLIPEIIEMINEVGTRIKVDKIKELASKCRDCAALAMCKAGCFYNTMKRECGTAAC